MNGSTGLDRKLLCMLLQRQPCRDDLPPRRTLVTVEEP